MGRSFPSIIAIASRNAGKIREIQAICADWPVQWVTAADHPDEWRDVEETGETYLDNAVLKAHAVAGSVGEAALADDSGIEVDALGGAPGVRSARYAGPDASDEANLRKLIEAVRDLPAEKRVARYRCVAVMAEPGADTVWAEGTCEGVLTPEPRGTGGFGYDPIFIPEGFDRTMAELDPEEKDRISHRGMAFRALRERIDASP